ncbi:hypothetical protein [Aliidiomarina celeris]|uniref:hypothetical protein n=1 Tax=Aliidiomarina celeris TaxID=2249428 RepID=UPI000DEBEBD7|nr:hypothetical protein [Aliidiomarina celeris]
MLKQPIVRVLLTVALFFSLPGTLYAESASQPRVVYVAAYDFPPYFSTRESQDLTSVLVAQLNQRQSEFQFVIREIRPSERYQAVSPTGCCDILFFEAPQWGWPQSRDYVWSSALTTGTERFYALKARIESGEVSFSTPGAQRIGGVLGYHYEFANFKTDRSTLEVDYNLYSTDTPGSLLQMLDRERIELALLNDEFVKWRQHLGQPSALALMGAEMADHHYHTRYVVKRSGLLAPSFIDNLLKDMLNEGLLQQLFADFNIRDSLYFGNTQPCDHSH